ncbi:MAG: UDP-N-acetylglucosamine 4,6-dehydratase (inverting), partial [Bacteroidota bacterium]
AMVTETDALNTLETPEHYIIIPTSPFRSFEENRQRFVEAYDGKSVPEGFSYISGDNTEWLGVEELRTLIKQHVDPNFTI